MQWSPSAMSCKRFHGRTDVHLRKRILQSSGRSQFAALLAGSLTCVVGCHQQHNQSMLHPAGPAASHIAWVWWFLFILCTAIFILVLLLTAVAIWVPRTTTGPQSPLGNRFIIVTGVIIPGFVLVALLVVSVRSQVVLGMPETDMTIRVTGHMWWWEVEYPDLGIVTANEIHIPIGKPVRIELTSADVIHSLWVPNLQGKMDLLPDKVNATWLLADKEGIYRGQCAEFCGVQHAWMGLEVIAMNEERFNRWADTRQSTKSLELSGDEQLGKEVFFKVACHNCHAIAGTQAVGTRGPNLTHLASRRTIAAGLLENNHGNLSGWVANPQTAKPGNLMPRTHINSEDLRSLVIYLETLR